MNIVQKFKAQRLGVKIPNLKYMSEKSHILMEQHSRLGNVNVKLPFAEQALSIGAYSYVREGSEINFLKAIGRYCSIGRGVVLGQAPDNHPIHWVSTSMSVSKDYVARNDFAVIDHDVWIAHDAVVMAGVTIGTGAVIGRNAVVTKDVQPYEIVVGNPGKVIRKRFTDAQIDALLESQWWELDHSELDGLPFHSIDEFLERVASISTQGVYEIVSIKNRRVSLYR